MYMSLKQECIDMINLITEPLAKNDDLYEYEIYEDSYIGFCLETKEDDYSCFCCECEHFVECNKSKMVYVKVDIELSSPMFDEVNWYFVFGRKEQYKELCGKIHYINTRKQLMNVMKDYKKSVEEYRDYYANFGERYSDYMEYAKEFGEQLKKDYLFFGTVNTDTLPIVFHTDFAKDGEGKIDYTKKGELLICGNQNVINTYYCMEDVEETRRNMRHELLHYFLYMSNMKYHDDDAIFHYLCGLYDAHAYKEMGEEEREMYDKLFIAVSELRKRKQELNMEEECFQANCTAILFTIGSNRESVLNKELFDNGMRVLNVMNEISKRKNKGDMKN